MKRTTKRATVALDLQKLDSPGLVSFTRAVCKATQNNSNLTAADVAKLPVSVADLGATATTLETTHTTRLTSPSKTNTKLEHDQGTIVMEHLTNLANFIEGLANVKAAGDVTLAGSIITSFGFRLKSSGVKPAKGFKATSKAKGAAEVEVPAAKGNEARFIRYSIDGQKTYSPPRLVHGTIVIISNLKSSLELFVQLAIEHPPPKKTKQVIVAGNDDLAWGDPVSCIVM